MISLIFKQICWGPKLNKFKKVMLIYIRAIKQQLRYRLYFSVPLSSLTDILPSIRIFQISKREKFEKQMHRITSTPGKLSTWKEFSKHGAVLPFPFVQQEENTSGWSKQVIKSKQNNALKQRRLLFISQNNWRVFQKEWSKGSIT